MGVDNFLSYEKYITYQNKQLSIWGQPCTIYHPTNKINLGYETVNEREVEQLNADKSLSTDYSKYECKVLINFTVNKSVYYRFNWFPEENEELCLAFFNTDTNIQMGDYIRTSMKNGNVSIWGDMIFEIRKIQDIGIGNVLQRMYFLKPTNNLDLHKELNF